MANPVQLNILKQGVKIWNKWRNENPNIKPDLSEANLDPFDIPQLLNDVNFSNANLSRSKLAGNSLIGANLQGAILNDASLVGVNFTQANLEGANLQRANLSLATLVGTNFTNANIDKARVYGISVWNIKKEGLTQTSIIITPYGEPEITVDDLEVAQLSHLIMLNNQKIRDVIDAITSKAVLILGRFTPERKAVLDAIKDELRLRNYLPIVFDFENAHNKSIDETVNLLARMSRFVIADMTDAKSIPQELSGFVPDNPSIPIVPLIWKAQREYSMFDHFRRYPWVLPLYEYESPEQLMNNIITAIITPAEQKVLELRIK